MASIPLLQVGCSGQEIIDTVNAIIARLGDGSGLSVSYNDLTDKPSINGVELAGDKTTGALRIAMGETTDYQTLIATLATKAYADEAKAEAVEAAEAAAEAALDGKLDKDLSNIEAATSVGDEAYIPAVSGNKVVKITTASLAAYTEIKNKVESSTYEAAVKTQRKSIGLTGAQDGKNIVFTADTAFQQGSSALYLNGNRLYLTKDYNEDSSTQITFKTYIPEAEDVILLEAIPLS